MAISSYRAHHEHGPALKRLARGCPHGCMAGIFIKRLFYLTRSFTLLMPSLTASFVLSATLFTSFLAASIASLPLSTTSSTFSFAFSTGSATASFALSTPSVTASPAALAASFAVRAFP